MRDYKKTISDLRNFNANYESNKLTNDAANAIEELLVKAGLWHQRYQLEHEKVEKLRSAVPHWISVEEYRDTIIHTLQEHRMLMDESYDDSDFALGYAEAFKVVCMMSLPEPPKEVEKK